MEAEGAKNAEGWSKWDKGGNGYFAQLWTGEVQDVAQCVQRKRAGLDAVQLFSSPRVSEQQPFLPQAESLHCRLEYFSGGLCIALTIGLFVAAVELAVLFPVLAGTATKAADGEGPALFIDAN